MLRLFLALLEEMCIRDRTLECELVKVIDGSKYLVEIKNVSADEKYLGDDGEIDLNKFTPITYDPVHHGYYRLGERVGNAFKLSLIHI